MDSRRRIARGSPRHPDRPAVRGGSRPARQRAGRADRARRPRDRHRPRDEHELRPRRRRRGLYRRRDRPRTRPQPRSPRGPREQAAPHRAAPASIGDRRQHHPRHAVRHGARLYRPGERSAHRTAWRAPRALTGRRPRQRDRHRRLYPSAVVARRARDRRRRAGPHVARHPVRVGPGPSRSAETSRSAMP